MSFSEEFLKDKHCVKVSKDKLIAYILVNADIEIFFNFCFDHSLKIEVLDLERYINVVRLQPRFKHEKSLTDIVQWHKKSEVPICLNYDENNDIFHLMKELFNLE